MNPIRSICLLACLLAVASASHLRSNSLNEELKPSDWMSARKLESLPALHEITVERLEKMSALEGAKMLNDVYSIAQTKHQEPTYKPRAEEIPAFIAKPNGQKVEFKLNELVSAAKRDEDFAKTELTVFITGLPENSNAVRKANQKLIRSYMQRYNGPKSMSLKSKYEVESDYERSSEERYNSKESKNSHTKTGDLVVIDLAKVLRNFEQYAKLDTTKTGKMIAELLNELTNETPAGKDKIFIVAQGIAAHVAGACGRQYNAITGHKLRRITALEPSKIFANKYETLVGLTRGDADFVDAIHTSRGFGTPARCGNVDFYVNGPTVAPEGADDVFEAAALATSVYAESLIFGNEHSFPAIRANSLEQYKSHQGMGPRAFMGIACEYDTEGDYILEVNMKSPHGRRTPAHAQRGYHASHQSWKKWNKSEEY